MPWEKSNHFRQVIFVIFFLSIAREFQKQNTHLSEVTEFVWLMISFLIQDGGGSKMLTVSAHVI